MKIKVVSLVLKHSFDTYVLGLCIEVINSSPYVVIT
jgi:hypothetical protein